MKKIILNSILFIAIFLISSSGLALINSKVDIAQASTTGDVKGWLWSDTIGWVSLNCVNVPGECNTSPYKVTQNVDGTWTGYGWSDTVGWLQFGGVGCPSGAAVLPPPCSAEMVGNNLKGWARFINSSNGWDGWISLSSTNDHDFLTAGVQTSPNTYGGTLSGVNVTGFVWGSDVVGWLQLSGVTIIVDPGTPTGTLSASDCFIAIGASYCTSTVSWTTANLIPATPTEITRNIGTPTSFTPSPLAGGSQSATLDGVGPVNFFLYHNAVILDQHTANALCIDGSSWNGTICVAGTPSVTLTAARTAITQGQSTTLTWVSSNVTSCSVSASPASPTWFGSRPVNSLSPESTGALNMTTRFSISCTGPAGPASSSVRVTVGIADPEAPTISYFQPYSCVGGGGSFGDNPKFAWDSLHTTSCTITRLTAPVINQSVGVSSQASGGFFEGGLYYFLTNLPVVGNTSNYKIQCINGVQTADAFAAVNICSPDFTISANPTTKSFVNGVNPGTGNTGKVVTYTISVNPISGFGSDVALAIQSSPRMPASTSFTFTPSTVGFNGSGYDTSILTIGIDDADFPPPNQSVIYTPIVIEGSGGGFSHTATVTADATGKKNPPIYIER